ncbi:MAG TPA: M23 family metallopeptidase [Allosphingosinicella sp.]|uniref:M23 family metallopeptidase n=1 Tax=Allosphingosinicella sp. TaxID=2823234 RepID=UPI002ED86D83
MRALRRIFTHLLTAVLTAAITSLYWYGTYGRGSGGARAEPGPELVEKAVATAEGPVEVSLGPTGLAIPVSGIRPNQLVDTYKQARAGGARVHDAIDIMAPHGTPVIAAAPGRVEKLFFSKGGGGITAYVRSDDGKWIYYYAHLQDYAPGLKEGQKVERGSPIGRVGATGNANPDGPHLHFAIHRMVSGEDWHEGTAINPYPLLAGKR